MVEATEIMTGVVKARVAAIEVKAGRDAAQRTELSTVRVVIFCVFLGKIPAHP